MDIYGIILPIDFHIFQRGGEKPPNSKNGCVLIVLDKSHRPLCDITGMLVDEKHPQMALLEVGDLCYPQVNIQKLNMAIEIVDLPISNGDFP